MKLLLVSATKPELGSDSSIKKITSAFPDIEILITGIGMVKTTYSLTVAILKSKPDFVLNVGICGSFSKQFSVGSLVNVVSEEFADFGIDDNGKFIPIREKDKVSESGKLENKFAKKIKLPLVKGITVNTVNGQKNVIKKVVSIFNPDVESMEGAAVFFVCLMNKIPFAEIRSVSNFVAPRNTSSWNKDLAIDNLNKALPEIISKIHTLIK
ncbi:MAG: futalosine hydrolase [Bacteroidia bacterium]|nr:futalosine hydrolase [Bacteroidia bacterium]